MAKALLASLPKLQEKGVPRAVITVSSFRGVIIPMIAVPISRRPAYASNAEFHSCSRSTL